MHLGDHLYLQQLSEEVFELLCSLIIELLRFFVTTKLIENIFLVIFRWHGWQTLQDFLMPRPQGRLQPLHIVLNVGVAITNLKSDAGRTPDLKLISHVLFAFLNAALDTSYLESTLIILKAI